MFALTSCFDLVYLSLRPGIEKLLCQSFPVHNLQISHLTSAEPWKTLSLIVCCVLSKFGSWFRVLLESHQRSCTASLAMPTTSKPLQLPTLVLCQCVTWRSSMLQWRGVMQTEKKRSNRILRTQLNRHSLDLAVSVVDSCCWCRWNLGCRTASVSTLQLFWAPLERETSWG